MTNPGASGLTVPAFLAAFSIVSGCGWMLASRYADARRRFLVVGYLTLAAGCLFAVSALGEVGGITESSAITWAMLGFAAFAPGLLLRVFMWKHNWQPAWQVQAQIAGRGPRYDKLEVIFVSALWLLTITHFGRGWFTGPSTYFWNIAGGIAVSRTFDVAAAAGIASSRRLRLILLWAVRVTVIAAIVVRVAAWA